LFSDVVMPHGISGVALAAEARAINQDLEILLTSGYPALRDVDLGSGDYPILSKPYRRDDLARMLSAALGARRDRRAGRPRPASKGAEMAR
jgi:DNA-binding NtrC family response regulator